MTNIVASGEAFDPPYVTDDVRDPRGLYSALEAAPDATDAQLKALFRKMSKRHHPDAGGDKERYQAITHAYDILKNPASRKVYDESGCLPLGSDKVRAHSFNMLTQALNQYLDKCPDPKRENLVDFLKYAVKAARKQAEDEVRALQKKHARLSEIARRFKGPDDHPLRRHIAQRLRAVVDERQNAAANVEALILALEEADKFAYEVDPPEPWPTQSMSSTSSSLGGFGSIFTRV